VYKAAVQRIRYKWSKPLGISPSAQAGSDGTEVIEVIPAGEANTPVGEGTEAKPG